MWSPKNWIFIITTFGSLLSTTFGQDKVWSTYNNIGFLSETTYGNLNFYIIGKTKNVKCLKIRFFVITTFGSLMSATFCHSKVWNTYKIIGFLN